MTILKKKLDANQYNLKDQVVSINRVTKVVKGGKNMSFAALVVVGDAASGVVGYGSGKAKEVPQAIRKGIESAKKNLVKVNLTDTSIPHQVLGWVPNVRLPIQYSETPLADPRAAPAVGEHTREILSELGYDDEQVSRLIVSGALGYMPHSP